MMPVQRQNDACTETERRQARDRMMPVQRQKEDRPETERRQARDRMMPAQRRERSCRLFGLMKITTNIFIFNSTHVSVI